jgi:hypothetical protein
MMAALVGYASTSHDNVENVVSMGGDTYSIRVEAKSAFNRDGDKLKAEASDAAANYCAAQGKVLKVVSLTGKVPMFSTGYANAKIVFKALSPGDPELSSPPPSATAGSASVAPAARQLTTDELYNELMKLDDLRKKGILSDEEFQAEKKKVLSHSN